VRPHFLTIGSDGTAEESTAPASAPINGAALIGRDRVAPVASTYAESTATAASEKSDTGSFSWWHLSSAGFSPIETSVVGNAPLVSPRGQVAYETAAWPPRLVVSDLDGRNARVVWTSE